MNSDASRPILLRSQMNRRARRDAGEIQGGVRLAGRQYSVGDRLLLGANDPKGKVVRVLEGEGGVRNGSLGSIVAIVKTEMRVRIDDRRLVAFDPKNYHGFAHGYATTIHKAQGITIDRAYLLADSLIDRGAAYVGLTRHRKTLRVVVPRRYIKNLDALAKAFSRVPRKDLVLDHISRALAEKLLAEERALRPRRETRLEPRAPRAIGDPKVRLAAIRRTLRDLDKMNRAMASRERLTLELGRASADDRPALRRALRDAERRLTALGDHEQLHVDLAVQVASLTPQEIARLPANDRQLATQLRAEQDTFLRDILEKVAGFEKATPGSKRQRAAANAVSYLMRSARRRVVYRLTPHATRSALGAARVVDGQGAYRHALPFLTADGAWGHAGADGCSWGAAGFGVILRI